MRFYAALEVTISDKISIGLQAYSFKSSPCMVIYELTKAKFKNGLSGGSVTKIYCFELFVS